MQHFDLRIPVVRTLAANQKGTVVALNTGFGWISHGSKQLWFSFDSIAPSTRTSVRPGSFVVFDICLGLADHRRRAIQAGKINSSDALRMIKQAEKIPHAENIRLTTAAADTESQRRNDWEEFCQSVRRIALGYIYVIRFT